MMNLCSKKAISELIGLLYNDTGLEENMAYLHSYAFLPGMCSSQVIH